MEDTPKIEAELTILQELFF
jgi:hypothetical protein